jgi:hypothetical protein
VVDRTAFAPVSAAELVDPGLLDSPRFGEYARNTVARYEEMQALVGDLAGLRF